MTQHFAPRDTEEDIRTFRNLRNFIGLFAAFALCLAIGVTIFAP